MTLTIFTSLIYGVVQYSSEYSTDRLKKYYSCSS